MRKVWKEIQSGREWIVDAQGGKLWQKSNSFRASAGLLTTGAGVWHTLSGDKSTSGLRFRARGVVSPLLSNILLTPFDQEMRRKGISLPGTRMTGSSPASPRGRRARRWPPPSGSWNGWGCN